MSKYTEYLVISGLKEDVAAAWLLSLHGKINEQSEKKDKVTSV